MRKFQIEKYSYIIRIFIRKFIVIIATVVIFSIVILTVADYDKTVFTKKTKVFFSKTDISNNQSTTNDQKINIKAPVYKGLKLVFEDHFNQSSIDSSIWNPVMQSGVANNELQKFIPSCVKVKNGKLKLTAKATPKGYISGKVDTKGKLELGYGRIDVRMKLCEGNGLFPAIWLLNEGELAKNYVEIDIMENLGNDPSIVYGVLHMKNDQTQYARDFSTYYIDNPLDYHVYSVEWNKDGVKWFIDGMEYFSTARNIPKLPMYIIINLAVGGNWPGSPDDETIFPASVYIDYVRIYEYEGNQS